MPGISRLVNAVGRSPQVSTNKIHEAPRGAVGHQAREAQRK